MSDEEKESSGLGFLLALGGAAAAIYAAYKVFMKPEVDEIELNNVASTVNKIFPTLISLAGFRPSLVNINVSASTHAGKYGPNVGGKNGGKYGGK